MGFAHFGRAAHRVPREAATASVLRARSENMFTLTGGRGGFLFLGDVVTASRVQTKGSLVPCGGDVLTAKYLHSHMRY